MGEPARKLPEDYDYEEHIKPKGYKRQSVMASGEFASSSFELPDKRAVPKFTFVSDNIRLNAVKPVTIYVSKGEELWFAENDKLNIYANGKDSAEAINDFTEQLIHFYKHYKSSTEDNLLQYARALKKTFLENFVEES